MVVCANPHSARSVVPLAGDVDRNAAVELRRCGIMVVPLAGDVDRNRESRAHGMR